MPRRMSALLFCAKPSLNAWYVTRLRLAAMLALPPRMGCDSLELAAVKLCLAARQSRVLSQASPRLCAKSQSQPRTGSLISASLDRFQGENGFVQPVKTKSEENASGNLKKRVRIVQDQPGVSGDYISLWFNRQKDD